MPRMTVDQSQSQRPDQGKLAGVYHFGNRIGGFGKGVVRRVRGRTALPSSQEASSSVSSPPEPALSPRAEQRPSFLASLRAISPFAARPSAVDLTCFPARFCQTSGLAAAQACQDLLTVGTRLWGPGAAQTVLKVKIYEFAVYMNGLQAKQSAVRRKYTAKAPAALKDANFYRELRSSSDIEMSLMVRAARDLPIKVLHAEYEKILKRRIQRVGGTTTDAALQQLLDCFREENIPDSIKQSGSVKKGTLLVFKREAAGRLSAQANEHELVSVRSPQLCQAVFDLYLGDQPVSRKAKQAAGDSFFRLDGTASYQPPQDTLVCAQASGNVCLSPA